MLCCPKRGQSLHAICLRYRSLGVGEGRFILHVSRQKWTLPSIRHVGSKHNRLAVTVTSSLTEITGIFKSSYRSMAIIVHCLCSPLFQITVILQLGFLCNALIRTQTYPCIKWVFFFLLHLITAFNIIGFLGKLVYVYVSLRQVL